MINMQDVKNFIGFKRVPNYNITLRNFLFYVTYNLTDLKMKLGDAHTDEEKNGFIYNCALITINDFFSDERYYIEPQFATLRINEMFEENFKLQQFDNVEVAHEVPCYARKMVDLFGEIKEKSLDSVKLMHKSRKLIASVD